MQAVESLFRSLVVMLEKNQNSCITCSDCLVKLWQSTFFITIMKSKKAEIVLKWECGFNRPFF